MILLELFLAFLQVGLFSFGGAYSAIPLIREVVLSHGWLTDQALVDMIAVSESTPGPIMVNMATFVGATQAGLPGAIAATIAVVLPSFVVMLLVVRLLHPFLEHPGVRAAMHGLLPTVVAIILATGLVLLLRALFPNGFSGGVSWQDCVIALILGLSMLLPARRGKKPSSVRLILLGAGLGVLLYGI